MAADEESIHPERALRETIKAVLEGRVSPGNVDPLANELLKLFQGLQIEFVMPEYAWSDPTDAQMARECAERAFQTGSAVANYHLAGVLVRYHGLLRLIHRVIGCDPDCERQFHLPMRHRAL